MIALIEDPLTPGIVVRIINGDTGALWTEDGIPMAYKVIGTDWLGRSWLTLTEDDDYQGYNGDLIVQPIDDSDRYELQMADDRNSFPFDIRLELVAK